MDFGKLDRRVTIQTLVETQDTLGEPIQTWADLATVWASVEPLRGGELFQAQQVSAEAQTRFRMRYRDDVVATSRLVYDSQNYDIKWIGMIGRFEGLEILARVFVS